MPHTLKESTTLTMSEPPTTGDDMYCIFGLSTRPSFRASASIQGSHIHTTFDLTGKTVTLPSGTLSHSTKAVGDASTTTFTIASRTVDDVLVFVNGICLVPTDDYTISGTTLTFCNTNVSALTEITIRLTKVG